MLAERGSFPGELVIVAIGMHEAPGGRGEDLTLPAREPASRPTRSGLRARRANAAGRASGCATSRSRSGREGMVTHELQTAGRDAQPELVAARVIEAIRARTEELADGGARVGRARDVLPRRGARRRLLQPLSGRVPARRHAPLGAREHAGEVEESSWRYSRRSRRSPAARSTSTCSSCAGRTRSILSTGSPSRSARRTATSPARSCP